MLIIEQDGSVVQAGPCEPAEPQQAYVELVAQPGADLTSSIEQILALVFDQLKLPILDIRIRQAERPE